MTECFVLFVLIVTARKHFFKDIYHVYFFYIEPDMYLIYVK